MSVSEYYNERKRNWFNLSKQMRKMTYDPELRKVKLEYSPDMRLYEYSLSEVMLRPNTRPFFIFAESNSGKTVIGVDMFVKAMSSGIFN